MQADVTSLTHNILNVCYFFWELTFHDHNSPPRYTMIRCITKESPFHTY